MKKKEEKKRGMQRGEKIENRDREGGGQKREGEESVELYA
jgi:hypothetical protein